MTVLTLFRRRSPASRPRDALPTSHSLAHFTHHLRVTPNLSLSSPFHSPLEIHSQRRDDSIEWRCFRNLQHTHAVVGGVSAVDCVSRTADGARVAELCALANAVLPPADSRISGDGGGLSGEEINKTNTAAGAGGGGATLPTREPIQLTSGSNSRQPRPPSRCRLTGLGEGERVRGQGEGGVRLPV